MCDTNLKTSFFTIKGQITHVWYQRWKPKYEGAQVHITIDIPIRFHEYRLKEFWVTHDTNLKNLIFVIQGQITHVWYQIWKPKYGGAQVYITIDIPMKFHDCRLKSVWVMRDTNLKTLFFTIQGQITHFW